MRGCLVFQLLRNLAHILPYVINGFWLHFCVVSVDSGDRPLCLLNCSDFFCVPAVVLTEEGFGVMGILEEVGWSLVGGLVIGAFFNVVNLEGVGD